MVQNLYSERELSIKLLLGEKTKKNISPFPATHTYIKLTFVSFFLPFFAPFPYHLLSPEKDSEADEGIHIPCKRRGAGGKNEEVAASLPVGIPLTAR